MSGAPRSLDLQSHALDRLTDRLDGVVPATAIIPVEQAANTTDEPVRVAVGATMDRLDRENKLESAVGRVRVLVDASPQFVAEQGTAAVSDVQDRVITELTTHSSAWGARGLRNQTAVASDSEQTRYLGAVETVHERTDRHPSSGGTQ